MATIQQYTQVFNGAGQSLKLPSGLGGNHYRIQIVGSGTLTLQLQDSMDGTNFVPIRVRDENAGTDSVNMAVASIFYQNTPIFAINPRLFVSAFTSGSFTVTVQWMHDAKHNQFPTKTMTFTAGGQALPLVAMDEWSELILIQVVGSGSMTLQLQDSLDGGVTYVPLRTIDVATGTGSTDMTVAGLFFQNGATGLCNPRLFVSAFVSGTLTVFVAQGGGIVSLQA